MRIAFYAPLKAPDHPAPSGDRRMARLLWQALEIAGHTPALASSFRSYEGEGSREKQAALERDGRAEAARLIGAYKALPAAERPQAWLTYHLYHKAPDWFGPAVSEALGIPYLLVEASYARKQAGGAYAQWLENSAHAIARANIVLSVTPEDEEGIAPLVRNRACLHRLTPFLDPLPYQACDRSAARIALADTLPLDPARLWLLTVAMMRPGDKLASYRLLGRSLGMIADPPWHLIVVGDGAARAPIEEALAAIGDPYVVYAGARAEDDLPAFYAACDLFVWPAYNEAYGMAMLEAQAAGLPVVAGNWRGVPEVVADGETGVLTPQHDDIAFAEAVVRLSDDTDRRRAMGAAASARVRTAHGLNAAAATLQRALDVAVAEASPT
jgi:glycosyltransferase involved in cell wall biosynthesis